MPDGAVYVGRPTQWGNPFTVTENERGGWSVDGPQVQVRGVAWRQAVSVAVREYSALVISHPKYQEWVAQLRGKDLACWCPLGQPCHADVLLELANAKEQP